MANQTNQFQNPTKNNDSLKKNEYYYSRITIIGNLRHTSSFTFFGNPNWVAMPLQTQKHTAIGLYITSTTCLWFITLKHVARIFWTLFEVVNSSLFPISYL